MAPNGRLYAGDLLQQEDLSAALSDFAQIIELGSLKIGDTGIAIVKYGAGEARLSSALRTDGILRALGGLYAGAFTTTQRDAIASGSRPYGLIILNSTLNRYEWNQGTDATPIWVPFVNIPQSIPPGAVFPYAGGTAPAGYLLCKGAAFSRATYSVLFGVIGTTYGAGDGTTTFNVPDIQGRVPVGVGTHTDVDAPGKNEGLTLANRRPKHRHTVNDPGHTHSYRNPLYQGVRAPGNQQGTATDEIDESGSKTTGITVGANPTLDSLDAQPYMVLNYIIST